MFNHTYHTYHTYHTPHTLVGGVATGLTWGEWCVWLSFHEVSFVLPEISLRTRTITIIAGDILTVLGSPVFILLNHRRTAPLASPLPKRMATTIQNRRK
jgi:hypothetical protein